MIPTPTTNPALLIPLKQAAAQLGISYTFLHKAQAAGIVKVVRFGTHIMVSTAELERLATEGIPPFPHA